MAVLLDYGMSVHHVVVAMVTAVEVLVIAMRYLNEVEDHCPTKNQQYYLVHIA